MFWKRKTELQKLIIEYGKDTEYLLEMARFIKKSSIRAICREDLKLYYKAIIEPQASKYYQMVYMKAVNKFFRAHGSPYALRTEEVVEFTPNDAIMEAMETFNKFNPTPRTKRNKRIVELKDKGWSFSEIASEVGLRSKANVHGIYWREKNRSKLSPA